MKQVISIFSSVILASCIQSNSVQKVEQETSVDKVPITTELKNDERKLNQVDQEKLNITKQGEVVELKDQSNFDEHTDYQQKALDHEYNKAKLYQLKDTIKADLNGDGIIDKAFLVRENPTSGLIIEHGKNKEQIKIGFGKSFGNWTNFDLNWITFWGLIYDKETFEIVIEDSEIAGQRIIKLEHPSIVVRKESAGGGIITYKNGKYEWIHQSD